jgi:putative transposase
MAEHRNHATLNAVRIHKTIIYRVYPSAEQAVRLSGWEDTLRWLWNLAHEQRLYGLRASTMRYYSAFDQINELTALRAELPWLADVPSSVCSQALIQLDRAWQLCFKSLARRPHWKRYGQGSLSFSEPMAKSWWIKNGLFHFPKLGTMPVVVTRPLEGTRKTARLIRDVDQWFVHIVCEIERDAPSARTEPVVALDRGITVLVADSDGNRIENPRHLQKTLKRIAHAQRVVSRRKKGSKNREKAKIRVAKLHRTVRRQRDHSLHTISSRYSKSHAVVVIEDLRIENMIQNPNLARSIADASWGRLGEFLRYKCEWTGGECAKVPAAYSSQTCAACGHVDAASRRGIVFCCTRCAHLDHADNNASLVLKQRYLQRRADESSVTGCGGPGARGRPVKQQLRAVRRKKSGTARPSGRAD